MPKPKYDVFLSHSSTDKPWVERLARKLRKEGLRPFLDKWHLIPGQPWQEGLERALVEESGSCVVVVGHDGVSPWEDEEMRSALTRARQHNQSFGVFALLLPGVEASRVPPFLANRTWVAFLTDDDEEAFYRLVCGIRGEAPEPKFEDEHTQTLSLSLADAYQRKGDLASLGKPTDEIDQEILRLKREMREGGRLKAGDSLLHGRFQLHQILGRGGFATVWQAWDSQDHELVAVKVLHGQYGSDRTRRERFFRGARQMARLHHQGILRIIEQELEDLGFHFFVMEYAEGGDLRRAVLEGRVDVQQAPEIIREVGAALQHAHEQGVIHRDIKPANILLDRAGRPKLTDFDLVRAADTTGGTRTGMLGTFVYAAPEAMEKPQDADGRMDLYGLGMTAAFILHGADLSGRVLRDIDGFILGLDAPEGIRHVILTAVEWEPDDRYPTVAAFLEALDKAMEEPDPETASEPESSLARPKSRKVSGGEEKDYSLTPIQEILAAHGADPEPLRKADALTSLLETGLPTVEESNRPRCALATVKAWPQTTDPTDLGILAWSLDYFALRTAEHATEARRLRDQLLAPLRDRYSPSPLKEWIDIPAGHFVMGAPKSEEGSYDNERPQHRVDLSAFRMLAHPITNRDFRHLVPDHGRENDLPAVEISWYEAYAYAAWLGGRLPTEAEWEYACRAGSTTRYCNGDSEEDLKQVGWYDANSGNHLHPVRKKAPNAWGLYDMHGNAWEWVSDWYGPYSADKRQDPPGPAGGGVRVVRGGCYWCTAVRARSAYRGIWDPGNRYVYLGFRVVLPVAPSSGQ